MKTTCGIGITLLLSTTACASPPEPATETAWGTAAVIEELTIGVEFGDDEYMFGGILSLAVAADGAMYVSDRQQDILRMYDEDGVFVRNVGGKGQGPGEYSTAPMLGVLPGGELVARDAMTSRISFFSAAGDYLDGFAAVPGGFFVIDRDGNIHAQRFEGDIELLTYSRDGEELGRFSFPPQDRAGDATFVLGFGEGDIFAFPTETVSAWSPDGYLVTGRNDAYDVELRKPEGTIHLRRDIEPAPVAGEEQAEWEAFRQSLVQRAQAQGRDTRYEPIPDVKPFFRQIRVGEDGRIWLFRYVAAEKRDDIEPLPDRPERPLLTWREPWTYDVFEPDGTFLGSVIVPETFRPFVFRGDRMWGALEDAVGVERVVRLRLVEPF